MSDIVKTERSSSKKPDRIMLSFSKDPHTTATVTWRTDTSSEGGYLEYRTENGERLKTPSRNRTIKTDTDESIVHWATAEGLTPGTKYTYTVGNDEIRSAEFSFRTEPENLTKFKFILITDHQRSSPWELPSYDIVRKLLHTALERDGDCAFILTAGDNCDNGQNDIQWNGMFSGLEGIIESIPYMMCTGNHDNRGFMQYLPEPVGKFYLPHADLFDEQFEFSYPHNGPEEFETENYSFDYGNAHFAVFGINRPDLVGDWLYEDLQASDKTWKIGAYHFPVFPVMPEGVTEDSCPWLLRGIARGRLDLLFNGHEHSLARTFPMRDYQMFDRPSQGTVHYIAGNASRGIFCSNAQKMWHSMFYPQEEAVALYCLVEVDTDRLTLTAYLEDGRIADRFTIDKSDDMIYPYALAPVYRNTKVSYKGRMLELASRDHYALNRDGTWYYPFALLAQAIGAQVDRRAGEVFIAMHKTSATFYEGKNVAATSSGDVPLSGGVFRERDQLYIPIEDAAKIFDMEWHYAERNNVIDFNRQTEERPMWRQP
ncbi:MAG: hypothetical protein GX851_03915 [Clostridiales bacterium]|nr:hypothetical protein [Clostridiales bacterium]